MEIKFIVGAIVAGAIAMFLLEAVRSPLADSFEKDADFSSRVACESRASLEGKNPKDCWK